MRPGALNPLFYEQRPKVFSAAPIAWTIHRWPAITLAAILFLSLIGLSPVAIVGPDINVSGIPSGDGDTLKQAIYVLLFLLIAWYAAATRGVRELAAVPWPLAVVLGWCWLSLSWAVDPSIAFRRVVLATLAVTTVTYAVRAMPARTVLNVLSATLAVVLVADWISIPLFHYALQQADEVEKELAGDWRGLHNHKNEAGAFCAMASIIFVSAAYRARSRISGPLIIAATLAFLWLTKSKTSIGFVSVGMLIGLLAEFCYKNPPLRRFLLVASLLAIWGVVAFDAIPYDAFVAAMDDPAAFTGRSQIWSLLAQYAGDHFLFGAGYGSFWGLGTESPLYAYTTGWVTTVFEAHDGYLDLQVQIGFIGLAMALALLVIRPLFILFCRPLRTDTSRWLLCSILAFGFLHNLLESSILNRSNGTWVIMIIMYVLLEDARVGGYGRRAGDVSVALQPGVDPGLPLAGSLPPS